MALISKPRYVCKDCWECAEANVLAGRKAKDPDGHYFICEIRRIP